MMVPAVTVAAAVGVLLNTGKERECSESVAAEARLCV